MLTETMTWMLAGLPQMCTDALSVVDRPVTLFFDGPGGGELVVAATGGAGRAHVCRARTRTAARQRSCGPRPHEFVCWGTKRRDWRSMDVTIEGDEGYAAQVLDAFNVI